MQFPTRACAAAQIVRLCASSGGTLAEWGGRQGQGAPAGFPMMLHVCAVSDVIHRAIEVLRRWPRQCFGACRLSLRRWQWRECLGRMARTVSSPTTLQHLLITLHALTVIATSGARWLPVGGKLCVNISHMRRHERRCSNCFANSAVGRKGSCWSTLRVSLWVCEKC